MRKNPERVARVIAITDGLEQYRKEGKMTDSQIAQIAYRAAGLRLHKSGGNAPPTEALLANPYYQELIAKYPELSAPINIQESVRNPSKSRRQGELPGRITKRQGRIY
jgi:hypothetical protein